MILKLFSLHNIHPRLENPEDLQAGAAHHGAADPGHDAEEQLQGAGAADARGHHGDAHLLGPRLCRGEGQQPICCVRKEKYIYTYLNILIRYF